MQRRINIYIQFTNQEKEQARHVDIASFLQARGEQLRRSGSEWEWHSGGEKITIRGCLWFNQYRQDGGNAVDFVRRFCDADYPTAMQMLLGGACGEIVHQPTAARQHKPFELPEANRDMRRVFAYLTRERHIDREVIRSFAHEHTICEDALYHNAVFIGCDEDGVPRHAHKRGTHSESSFKCNVVGSQPEYSFHHIGKSERIYVFEAPIDMLSFITRYPEDWQQDSYVALCSVSPKALLHQLEVNPQLHHVSLCLDNDQAGEAACERITEQLGETGDYHIERVAPQLKDWNEDLCAGVMQQSCQEMTS